MDRRLSSSLVQHGEFPLLLPGLRPIIVQRPLASGCSTLIYTARCGEQDVLLRELCPEGLTEQGRLVRQADGRLRIRRNAAALLAWGRERRRCRRAARLNLRLQRHPAAGRWVVPIHGLYRHHGTLCIPTQLPAGTPLTTLLEAPVPVILAAAVRILQMTETLHRAGWLLVDIKASNYVLYPRPDGRQDIRLTDLDSAVPLRGLTRQKRFLCSSETAPPELLQGRGSDAGPHSDVYSVAVILASALARRPCKGDLPQLFRDRIAPALADWRPESVRMLEELLTGALESDPGARLPDCRAVLDPLIRICQKEAVDIESIFA